MRFSLLSRLLSIPTILAICTASHVHAQSPGKGSLPKTPDNSSVSTTPAAGKQQRSRSARLLLGDRGPDFRLVSYAGKTIHLKDFRDKSGVVLVFVNTRKSSRENYEGLAQELKQDGIQLLFVVRHGRHDFDGDPTGVPVLRDRYGDVAKGYGAYDYVTGNTRTAVVILDRSGYVRFFMVGYLPEATALEKMVATTLEETEKETAGS